MARQKSIFKIYVECITDTMYTAEKGKKLLLASVTSKGNTYTCIQALKEVYKPQYWKMTIE